MGSAASKPSSGTAAHHPADAAHPSPATLAAENERLKAELAKLRNAPVSQDSLAEENASMRLELARLRATNPEKSRVTPISATARQSCLDAIRTESRDGGRLEDGLKCLGVKDADLRSVLRERLTGDKGDGSSTVGPVIPPSQEYEPLEEVRRLKQVPLLVMDNSLRESTVAALRGHTIDDKWKILALIEECGFQHIILGALSSVNYRVDDLFAEQVRDAPDFETRHKVRTYLRTRISL
ncbi:hypothetical protein CYMTET_28658 [Cymbomonas tetramitiformis]|uniref:Uncharacterized protein n=1 Tax=Cymbomonas tetramitiformis TaxID=36881 RepID=A0AAE0KW05_9CHLO|nr:hypothetical protein CYMTET_28658 [Cymbomonas tetramitiformis]